MRLRLHRALDRLSDARLHALLARVQTALFDRAPASPATIASPGLVVEIVDPAEGRLLALYRALPPARHAQALAALASLWARCAPSDDARTGGALSRGLRGGL